MASRPAMSVSEREVLKVLWDHGPRTVRALNEILERQGRHWAYTTVATLLQRLVVKEFAASDPTRDSARVSRSGEPGRVA